MIKFFVAVIGIITMGLCWTQNAFADMDGCDQYGGYCSCGGATSCGAAWLNNDERGNGNNGLWVNATDDKIRGYIHGAIKTQDHGVPEDAGTWNGANHVFLVDEPWPYGDDYGKWPNGDIGDPSYYVDTQGWAQQHRVWFIGGYDTWNGGWFNRGVVPDSENTWSWGWDDGPMYIEMDKNTFLANSWQIDDENFVRDVYLFRCYYDYRGCNTTKTTILVHVEENDLSPPEYPNWRVEYQGKISLKNDNSSPLYEHGGMLSSNSWPEASGWEDNTAYVYPNLYTPKESGQKLRTMYQLRWKCNNWDDIGCGYRYHWLSYYGTDFPYSPRNGHVLRDWGQFWTRYAYSSEVGLNNRKTTGNGTFSTGGRSYNDAREVVSPQRQKTISSIPYGTTQSYAEQLQYTSIGMNHKNVKETLKFRTCCGGDPRSCWTCVTNYITVTNTDEPHNTLNASRNMNLSVHNPYNFNTTLSSNISGGNGSTVLGGSTATLQLSANIKSKTQQESTASSEVGFPYYTKVPDNTEGNVPTVVTAASFILKPDTDANSLSIQLKDRTDVLKSAVPSNDLCNYIRNTFGNNLLADGRNNCLTLFTEDHNSINNNIGDTGWNTSTNNNVANNGVSAITSEHQNISVTIPDIEDGYKYCTIIGINHADSGGKDGGYRYASNYNDTLHFRTYSINDNWHLSNVSCRTIAKVPTFQTWGNIYTSGGIETTTVKKIPDADIETSSASQKYLFGSWSETFSLANKDIKNFGTGAVFGYLDNGLGGFPVADSNKFKYCNFTNMTIANSYCNNKGVGGNAGNVAVSNEDFLNKFVAHYATTSSGSLDQVSDTVRYYKASNHDINNGSANFNTTPALGEYRQSNGNIISLNNNTLIYQVDGNLTISDNICTGFSSSASRCRNGTPSNEYKNYNLSDSNVQYDATFSKIPQVIIIASGDVTINSNVNEIDAWIYAGGTIRTCDKSPGQKDGNIYHCHTPLVVNGPVFAKNIELRRTYGSYGRHGWNGPFTNKSTLFQAGASTPAEVFNLRADVYQWIYQQTSTDDKHTNVRYMRDMSPRY